MNLAQLLKKSITRLIPVFGTARLDAEVLLAFGLGWQRTHLISRDTQVLTPEQIAILEKLIDRRLAGEPVAYIVGQQEFWSLPLSVNTSTLIPRPETEHLVEAALAFLGLDSFSLDVSENVSDKKAQAVLDLGTGSGAIILALAAELPQNKYTAVDESEDALNVARHNAETLKIKHINFLQSDWFSALTGQKFHLIVSNPPYIKNADHHLSQGDVAAEPITALASGADGLDDIRIISQQAKKFLYGNGWLMMEHGWDQAEKVREILYADKFVNIRSIKDYSDIERLTIAQVP